MSISVLRLRRKALSLSTSIFNYHRTPLCSSAPALIAHSSAQNPKLDLSNFLSQFRAFRSSNVSFSFPRTPFNDDDRNIGPDDVLFEGCDYNHWLITMDFPKDSKPSAEEMVETYVQTAAKVLGSVEEAKRKIYACSTTTYQGFQVEVSEEVSKKFEGLPGVVFILPDSYIDPTNKEYGGDKYINGTIIHRPPPVHYGRGSGRFGDRNREFNRTNRGRGEYQQGSQTYGNQGSMQGSPSNFAAPQNPQGQQNYGPPRVNERQDFVPTNNSPGGQDGYQGYRRGQVPPSQGYYNHDQKGNSYPQGQSVPPGQLTNNAPPQVGNSGQSLNYGQGAGGGGGYGQGAAGGYGQGAAGGYGQGAAGSGGYGQGAAGGYGAGAISGGNRQQSAAGSGGYGQGAAGGYGAGAISGGNRQQSAAGGYGQGAGSGYGQGAGAVSGWNQQQGAVGGYGQGAGAVSGWNQQQGAVGGYGQGAGGGYRQGASGGYGQGDSGYSQGAGGGYSQGGSSGYSQDAGVKYGQVSGGGVPGHNKISDHGQSYSIHGENERLSQGEQMNDLRQVQQ